MKTLTLKVQGMMCEHCEARVRDALKKLSGVHEIEANASSNQVTCTYEETHISMEDIIASIEACGYDVLR